MKAKISLQWPITFHSIEKIAPWVEYRTMIYVSFVHPTHCNMTTMPTHYLSYQLVERFIYRTMSLLSISHTYHAHNNNVA